MSGPCDWPIVYSACASTAVLDQMDPTDKALVEEMAADLLWRWTGRGYGLCSIVARPQRVCYQTSFWGWGPLTSGSMATRSGQISSRWMMAGGGVSTFVPCGSCGSISPCGCSSAVSVQLPGPVDSITTVKVDGAVIPPGDYVLDNDRLIRTDGESWPTSQDLELPDTESGTWSVEYVWGREVPVGGQVAAGLLALELAKAMCGDSSCQLPKRVSSITRQGVTMAVLDGFDDLDKGRTGIWLIDSWVSSINASPLRSSVRSPDLPPTILRRAPVPPPP